MSDAQTGPFSGTLIFMHIRSTNDLTDRAKHDTKKAIKRLGGALTMTLEQAHLVVFHHGSEALRQNALALGKPVVKVSYLVECREKNQRLPIRPDHLALPSSDASNAATATTATDPNSTTSGSLSRTRPSVTKTTAPSVVSNHRDGIALCNDEAILSTQTLNDRLDAIISPDVRVRAKPSPTDSPSATGAAGSSGRKSSASKRQRSVTPDSTARRLMSPLQAPPPQQRPSASATSSNPAVAAPEEPCLDGLYPIRVKPRRLTITGPEEEKGMLADILVALGGEFELKVFGRVKKPTHYVVLSNAITPKILLARVTGALMLTKEWVTDSLAYGCFVEPLPRHIHPLYIAPEQLPVAAASFTATMDKKLVELHSHRLELSGLPPNVPSATMLFGMTFYLLGKSDNPTNDVYAELLKLMGADVAKRFDSNSHHITAVIEVDGGVARNAMCPKDIQKLRDVRLVSSAWIVETASTCQPAPFAPFSVSCDAALAPLSVCVSMLTPLAKTKRGPVSAVKFAENQLCTQQLQQQ